MSAPKDDTDEALRILARYQRALVEHMAREIVERKEDFESPFVGSAEVLIDKYYHLLQCLCPITTGLQSYARIAKRAEPPPEQEPQAPLGKYEFRCFRCRSIINADADSCPKCGWTWG